MRHLALASLLAFATAVPAQTTPPGPSATPATPASAATAAASAPSGWTKVTTGGPARRIITAMAFDEARGRTVMFGGDQARVGVIGETWTWDGATWQQHTGLEPEPRYGHVMAYDPERKNVVLFGGYDRGKKIWFPETWIWDGAAWTKHAVPGPSPRRSPAFAYNRGRRTVLLWGGLGENPDGTEKFLQDTWEWNGSEWKQIATDGPPPAYGSEIAYDHAARRLLFFGGNDHSNNVYNHTWRWTKDGWVKIETSGGPAPRGGAQLHFNPRTQRVHLYGGFSPGEGGRGLKVHLDEWSWNGTAWEEIKDPTQPPLVFPKMVYDSARDRLVYFGQRTFQSQESEVWEKQP